MDECLRVLKEKNKSTIDSYWQYQEQCIDHIPYHLSRNSCIKKSVIPTKMEFSRAFFRQSFFQDPASINNKKKKQRQSINWTIFILLFIVSSYDRLKVVGYESNAAADWLLLSFGLGRFLRMDKRGHYTQHAKVLNLVTPEKRQMASSLQGNNRGTTGRSQSHLQALSKTSF